MILVNKDYKHLKEGTYNKEYVLQLINKLEYKYLCDLYHHLNQKYSDDLDISIAISKNAPSLFKYLPYEHRNYKPIIKNCATINTDIYMHINEINKQDKEVILWCAKNKWMRATRLAENLLNDEDVAYKFCIKNASSINKFKKFAENEKFILKVMKKNSDIYRYLSENLRTKEELIEIFINNNANINISMVEEYIPLEKRFERHILLKIQDKFPTEFIKTSMFEKLKEFERQDKLLQDIDRLKNSNIKKNKPKI